MLNNLLKINRKAIMPFSEKSINLISKILIIFSLSFYLLSIFFLQQNNFDALIKVCGILAFIAIICLAYMLSSKLKSEKISIVFLALISFSLLCTWNLIYDAKPVSDYEVLLEGANSIINGNFPTLAASKNNYFYFYNFQIGYTFYLSILLRIFGDSLIALKIIEIITICLCNVFAFKIMRLFFTIQESFFTSFLLALNPYIFMGSGIINNQHISCLFCLMGLYAFLKHSKFLNFILCGILIAIAQILRPTAIIVLIGCLICGLLQGVFHKDKKILIGICITLVSYVLFFDFVNLLFIITDLAPIGIKSSNLYFKLVLGLTGNGITGNPTTDAYHTQLYYDLKTYNFDYELYKESAKEHLKNLFIEGKISYRWILEKMLHFTGDVDNQYHFADANFNTNHTFLVGILNFIGTLLYFASVLFSLIKSVFEKETLQSKVYMLCILIFGLYFFAYIVLETQPRYRYEQYFVLYFLSMPVFYKFLENIKISLKRG